MILAVDLGNTTCEFAIVQKKDIVKKFFISSKPLMLSNIQDMLSPFLNEISCAVVSSVVPNENNTLKLFLEHNCKIKTIILNGDIFNFLVKLQDRPINTVGMDILCKSTWAVFNKVETIIIDMGTATVIQYVSKQGYLEGVGITIGLSNIYKTLHTSTSLLPLISPKKCSNILGMDTLSAMEGGIYWGYIGLLNKMISKVQEETQCNSVVLTGGLSDLVVEDLECKFIHNKNIIFDGINIIYELNKDKI